MSREVNIQPEFSRTIAIEKIPPSGLEQILEAKEKERKALAERLGLLDLSKLTAKLTLHPARADQTIAVTGSLVADVVQQCVVTLEPLPAHIEREIKVIYADADMFNEGAGPSDMAEEDIELLTDSIIDLGELVVQNLGIALDPYPRKQGLEYVEATYGQSEPEQGPLAKLADWAKKPKDSR